MFETYITLPIEYLKNVSTNKLQLSHFQNKCPVKESLVTIMKLSINVKHVHFCKEITTHKVFVYGTLKQDEPNHHWLTKQENGTSMFISEGTTKTKYPLIIATRYNIPFLLYSPGDGHHVNGEVYEVDDLMLSNLDILEEHPKYYVRELDDISIPTGETIKCWVYFLKKFRPELLKRPHLEEYSSQGAHGLPYLERFKRDPNYDYKPEVTVTMNLP